MAVNSDEDKTPKVDFMQLNISTVNLDRLLLDGITSPSADSKMQYLIDDTLSSQRIMSLGNQAALKQVIADPTTWLSSETTGEKN